MTTNSQGNLLLSARCDKKVTHYDKDNVLQTMATKEGFMVNLDSDWNIVDLISNINYHDIDVDEFDNIYTAGVSFARTSLDLDPSEGEAIITPLGNSFLFWAKYTGDFDYVSHGEINNSKIHYAPIIAVNSEDHFYFGGLYRGAIDFDPDPLIEVVLDKETLNNKGFISTFVKTEEAFIGGNDLEIINTDPSFDLSCVTNSSKAINYEILSGTDLVSLVGKTISLKGNVGTAKIKASVPDDISTNTTASEFVFNINILKNQVITFDDITLQNSVTTYSLSASTNAPSYTAINYEIVSGDNVLSLSGTNNATVTPNEAGTAQVKVTFETNAADYVKVATKTINITLLPPPSKATISADDISVSLSDGTVALSATTNSNLDVQYQVISGAELVSIIGNQATLLDGGAIATVKASVEDDESSNTLANNTLFTISIIKDLSVIMDDISVRISTDKLTLSATTNAPSTKSVSFEIIEGSEVISLSGSNNSELKPLKVGIAKIKVGATSDAPLYTNSASKIISVSVKDSSVTTVSEPVSEILIYPVPADEVIHIVSVDQVKLVKILSATGHTQLTTVDKDIDVSALPKGYYFLNITFSDNIKTYGIVIQ